MNKKMREIKAKIEAKKEEIKTLTSTKDYDYNEATKLLDEVDDLGKAFDVERRLFEAEKEENIDVEFIEATKEEKTKTDNVKAFATAVRNRFKGMSEGSMVDGGYVVPKDISTQIEKLKETEDSLETEVSVISVKTKSGSRTFKKRSQQDGFNEITEGGTLGESDTPQYSVLEYNIKKYGGFYPATNELLEDTDQNIVDDLTTWIVGDSRVTRNKLIMNTILSKTAVEFKGLDDIKKAYNVDLDTAFRATLKIHTNQDGLQYLDTLKDNEGKYLLQPLVSDPTKYTFGGFPVKVWSNKVLQSDVSVVGKRGLMFIIGDLKEGIALFDRKQITIKMSDVAMGAFENDKTMFRAIEREDVKVRDDEAFIVGKLVINDSTVKASA